MSDTDCTRIINKIPVLAESVRTSSDGSCSDEIISRSLGDIVQTNMVGIDRKVLNQKRALWLTPEKARNICISIALAKANERVLMEEKNLARIRSVIGKRKLERISQDVNDGTIDGKREELSMRVPCANDCGLMREIGQENSTVPYDNWLGCTVCTIWFCSKTRCLARFKKHHAVCLRNKST